MAENNSNIVGGSRLVITYHVSTSLGCALPTCLLKRRSDGETSERSIDEHVGDRMRTRRLLIGLSQGQLAKRLDLTFQQIQKYEKGKSRIGAGRLFHISQILGVPITFFFEGLRKRQFERPDMPTIDERSLDIALDYVASPEGLTLNHHFIKIGQTSVRRRILSLIKSLADEGERRP